MLWIRGLAFTLLVPFMLGVMVPRWIAGDERHAVTWLAWAIESSAVIAGTAFYLMSLLRFLAASGTPSIYFLRPLRTVLGEEPGVVVERVLYGVTRNPMYVGVLTAIFGQALI